MKKYANPLDGIRIASPCAANWSEMFGDERKRYCAECKLNVYNLSEMTRTEAENFLINSEGRVCLQIFRRADGTVLTRDCPVGWRALKKKVSQTATAAFALTMGIFGGILSLKSLESLRSLTNYDKVPDVFFETRSSSNESGITFGGITSNLPEVKSAILRSRMKN